MCSVFAVLWDNSEIDVSAPTPTDAVIKAFKIAGCKTLSGWQNLIHHACFVGGMSDDFSPIYLLNKNEAIC